MCEADEVEIGREAAHRGVTATPLSRFCAAPTPHRGFMLGFAVADEGAIRRATRILAESIEVVAARRRNGRLPGPGVLLPATAK